MAYYKVHVLVSALVVVGEAAGHGALVKGMPDAYSWQQGRAGDAGVVVELVDAAGVGHKSRAAACLCGNVVGQDTPEVAGMLVRGREGFLNHLWRHGIYAGLNRAGQAAAAYHRVELHEQPGFFQFIENQLFSHGKLVDNLCVFAHFLGRVRYRLNKYGGLVAVNGYLR